MIPSIGADIFIVLESKLRLRIYSISVPLFIEPEGIRVGRVCRQLTIMVETRCHYSLAYWLEVIHSDIVTSVRHLLHIFTTSHPVKVWGVYDPKVCTRRGHFAQLLTYDIGTSHIDDQDMSKLQQNLLEGGLV